MCVYALKYQVKRKQNCASEMECKHRMVVYNVDTALSTIQACTCVHVHVCAVGMCVCAGLYQPSSLLVVRKVEGTFGSLVCPWCGHHCRLVQGLHW